MSWLTGSQPEGHIEYFVQDDEPLQPMSFRGGQNGVYESHSYELSGEREPPQPLSIFGGTNGFYVSYSYSVAGVAEAPYELEPYERSRSDRGSVHPDSADNRGSEQRSHRSNRRHRQSTSSHSYHHDERVRSSRRQDDDNVRNSPADYPVRIPPVPEEPEQVHLREERSNVYGRTPEEDLQADEVEEPRPSASSRRPQHASTRRHGGSSFRRSETGSSGSIRPSDSASNIGARQSTRYH